MMLGENLAKLRKRLLGPILLIAADQHYVLAFAGAFGSLVNDPRILGARDGRDEQECE